tara:strand:- start:26421 stop:26831 length:411 start_codon:yes stop_codon:yes gene_type:complete
MSERKSSYKVLQEARDRFIGNDSPDLSDMNAEGVLFTDILPSVESATVQEFSEDDNTITFRVNGTFPEGASYLISVRVEDFYSDSGIEEDEEEQVGMDDMAELLSVESDVPEVKALQQATRGQISKLRQQIQSNSY